MNINEVIIVRVYISESAHLLNNILDYLKKEASIQGVSVFRAISGFGKTGEHTSSFISLSIDLPLVIEFFDTKNKIQPALEHLNTLIKPEHIIFWEAKTNMD